MNDISGPLCRCPYVMGLLDRAMFSPRPTWARPPRHSAAPANRCNSKLGISVVLGHRDTGGLVDATKEADGVHNIGPRIHNETEVV